LSREEIDYEYENIKYKLESEEKNGKKNFENRLKCLEEKKSLRKVML
jgi:hypothetical protein